MPADRTDTARTAPLRPRPEVMDFLLTRRSRPAKTLAPPVPDRTQLQPILQAALRSPDHGKLEPWRLIVLERAALQRLGRLVEALGPERAPDPARLPKSVAQFANAHLAVAVIATPRPDPKVPEVEQILSAGAVCLGLLNAALASGWGANWLTGWMATDPDFLDQGLQVTPPDFVAGFIFIGTETVAPPERPRPDPARRVTWVSA